MEGIALYGVLAGMLVLLAGSCYAAVLYLLKGVAKPVRVVRLRGSPAGLAGSAPPGWLLLMLGLSDGQEDGGGDAERKHLLAAAGLRLHPEWYRLGRRVALAAHILLLLAVWLFRESLAPLLNLSPYAVMAVLAGVLCCLWMDRLFLEQLCKRRANLIMEEIYAVSRQLLYFAASPLPLHGKLMRCMTYTRLIRQDWQLLLNEWYQDAETAIEAFRGRLGTEEGYGFAETLNYLRLYDNEAYYHLLRRRVDDCKERLELLRDSRKESVSYALFVIAAVPIMYTFQIFIYPWVQEGQRLFQGLN
ncbi:MAG: hypothetical protein K0Q90_1991 [Paenibacillaceae bacterium]|jgi:hypothetical protein|nr:hypothetical protein [Paenibacillaceae bacterium]